MPALTHVCMWTDKEWKRISAEEAAKLHPGGTVSSKSGLFMCELCGQYVLLTDGNVKIRHFRHSSAEESKDCPERRVATSYNHSYKENDHELPVKITIVSKTKICLELGLIRIPSDLYSEELVIELSSPNSIDKHVYSGERLNAEGITYVPLGETPYAEYRLSVSKGNPKINSYWPPIIKGINYSGTLFDGKTGIKLPEDSDVTVGKKYYLLMQSTLFNSYQHMQIEKLCTTTKGYNTWNVYSVMAKEFNESTAKFFLKYHCRLTENIAAIVPVWPAYVENPYTISHNDNEMTLLVKGNVDFHSFPHVASQEYSCRQDKVIHLYTYNRQQMISVGRSKSLQYTYFMKMPLNQKTELPKVHITDVSGNDWPNGEINQLLEGKIIKITSPFDGLLFIIKDKIIMEKRILSANKTTEVDNISWNCQLKVYVGMDLVWECLFCKKEKEGSIEEEAFLQRLKNLGGPEMRIAHSLGSVASRLEQYPKLRRWVYECIRKGYMSRKAYLELQQFILRQN